MTNIELIELEVLKILSSVEVVEEDIILPLLGKYRSKFIEVMERVGMNENTHPNYYHSRQLAYGLYGEKLLSEGNYQEAFIMYTKYFNETGLGWESLLKVQLHINPNVLIVQKLITTIEKTLHLKNISESSTTPKEILSLITEIVTKLQK